jgi:hypothetical protein
LKLFDGKLDSTWPEFMESLAVPIKFIIPSLCTSFPQQMRLVATASSMMNARKKQERVFRAWIGKDVIGPYLLFRVNDERSDGLPTASSASRGLITTDSRQQI